MGYKVFTPTVLTSTDINSYLMKQTVMVFADATARGLALTAPTAGMVTYLTGTNALNTYNGSSWVVTGVTSAVAGTGISVSGATGAVTFTNTGVTSAVAGTGVGVSAATGAVTFSIGQSVATSASPTFAGITSTGNITSSTLIAANTLLYADALKIRMGAWSSSSNYSAIEGNKGFLIVGNTQNDNIYLRTFAGTGTVRIGGNNGDTLVVGDGTTSITGNLGTSTYITCSYLAAGATGITDGGSVSATNYFRSSGSTGWYNQTYGGGIYMNDAVRLKVFGGKSFHGNLGFESQISYGSYGSMSLYSTNNGWGGITFPDQAVTWMQGFGQAIFGVYRDNSTWNFYYNYATFVASDARYKREIKPLTFGLNLINALEPVEFKRLTERDDDDPEAVEEEIFYGFTAQQVKEALDLVGETRDTNLWDLGGPETIDTPSDRQYISEGTLIAPIVKALQELDTRLKTLEGV